MTVTTYPHDTPARMHVSVAPPSGVSLVDLMRLDRNGRTIWTAEQLGAPWSGFIYDQTCALAGPVEYIATYSDGSREAGPVRSLSGTWERPRLLRLKWSPAGVLVSDGNVWTDHAAVIDATYDAEEVSTVSRRGVAGLHSTRNHDRTDAGRLVIWCDTITHARNLRADLLRHPLQWLRAPDEAGMDHALIVDRVGVRHEAGAWIVDVGYTARADLTVAPTTDLTTAGYRTLGDHSGTLADLAATHDMLAEMR